MNESSRCCEVPVPATPEPIYNRPGLDQIAYRVGTFATFRRAMLESIAGRPELQEWTTRRSDDFGIALLEMWAYIADILTFYQERIANEAFLRTALHEETIRRLARRLDYRPAPGAAAEALLAFTLEDETSLRIPVGLTVQSVPEQDERPQKFETVEGLEAASGLNERTVLPKPEEKNLFAAGAVGAVLAPGSADHVTEAISVGDSLVLFDEEAASVEQKEVAAFEEHPDGRTTMAWSPAVQESQQSSRVFAYERTLRFFGHNAPRTFVQTLPDADNPSGVITVLIDRIDGIQEQIRERLPRSAREVIDETLARSSYHLGGESENWLPLDGTYDLKPGTALLLHVPSDEQTSRISTVTAVRDRQVTFPPLEAAVTEIKIDGPLDGFDRREAVVYQLSGPEIIFWGTTGAGEGQNSDRNNTGWNVPETIAGSTLYITSSEPVSREEWNGRKIFVAGLEGATGSRVVEPAVVDRAEKAAFGSVNYLELTLTEPLDHTFETGKTVLRGNVAAATHGETVASEVIGSGRARESHQSFALGKSPVTFTRDSEAARGVENTVELRVDGIRWKETERLYGHSGSERVYTTRIDDEQVMYVRFGDGEMGSRPSTGEGNITATYRHGLGAEGNVRAHGLQTLLDRPKGLSEVTNPQPADGGADPETREEARENAPNSVRTFDRIVSLRDFEDAAREYVGVAKARADRVWEGTRRIVRLTVAGNGGRKLSDTELDDFRATLDARRDPHRGLKIFNYREIPLAVELTVQPHPAYPEEQIREAAREAVLEYFSFDHRELGHSVHRSDLYRVVQELDGVEAVRLDRLAAADRALSAVGRLPMEADELATLQPSEKPVSVPADAPPVLRISSSALES